MSDPEIVDILYGTSNNDDSRDVAVTTISSTSVTPLLTFCELSWASITIGSKVKNVSNINLDEICIKSPCLIALK